ncbi:MAG: hypothetical protein AB2417_09570 [Clostridiaceae bacterium]
MTILLNTVARLNIENVDVIISDEEAPNEWSNSLNEYEIDWIKA